MIKPVLETARPMLRYALSLHENMRTMMGCKKKLIIKKSANGIVESNASQLFHVLCVQLFTVSSSDLTTSFSRIRQKKNE